MSLINDDTEKELMELSSRDDEAAFIKLFHLYRHRLFSFTLRITGSPEQAQDMVQDVFLKLWNDRVNLCKIENLGSFIFKLAQNQAINAFRRMANETLVVARMHHTSGQPNARADELLEYKEVKDLINDAIEKLPPQQGIVFRLSREQGLKYDEISLMLNISPYTVKNHLVLALHAIRSYLRDRLQIKSMLLVLLYCSSLLLSFF